VSYCVLAVYSLHACVLLCTCCVLTACRFETVYYCVLAVYSLHACVLLCTGCVFTTYTVELCTAVYLLRNCVLLCTCCVLRKFVYSTQKVDFFLMNSLMARFRVVIENLFAEIENQFAFLQHHQNKKLGLQDVGKLFPVAMFLFNARTLYYGSQTSNYYGLDGIADLSLHQVLQK